MNRGRKTKKRDEKDEVDELLQAAQDDMMLSLSVDSHITSLSDLDRRFNALKLKAKTPPASKTSDSNSSSSNSNSKSGPVAAAIPSSCSIQVDEELKAVLGDDLSTRFAALKASSSMPSSSSTMIMDIPEENDDDDEDEVEKLMRWAKDAARLDPSPPSDDEDDD